MSRWRPLPSADERFVQLAVHTPLLQGGRDIDALLVAGGEETCALERLLRCRCLDAHVYMAQVYSKNKINKKDLCAGKASALSLP